MIRRFITTAAAAAAGSVITLLGFGIAGAAPFATIPPNTYHGCVDTASQRTLKHVYVSPTSGTTCPSGQFQVIWPAGADNDPPPGTAGLDPIQVTTDGTVSFPDNTYLNVQCPSDHPYVLSGGGFIDDNSATMRDSEGAIPGPGGQFPQGWQVGFTFPQAITGSSGGRTSASATAYAICAK